MGFLNNFAKGAAIQLAVRADELTKKDDDIDKFRQDTVLKANVDDQLEQRKEARAKQDKIDSMTAAQQQEQQTLTSYMGGSTNPTNMAGDNVSNQSTTPGNSNSAANPFAAGASTTGSPTISAPIIPVTTNPLGTPNAPLSPTPGVQPTGSPTMIVASGNANPEVDMLRQQADAHLFTAAQLEASPNPEAKALAAKHTTIGNALHKRADDMNADNQTSRTNERQGVQTIDGVNPVETFLKEEQERSKAGAVGETQYLPQTVSYTPSVVTKDNKPLYALEQKSSGQAAKAIDIMTSSTADANGKSPLAYSEVKQNAVDLVKNKNIIADSNSNDDVKAAAVKKNVEILSQFPPQVSNKLVKSIYSQSEYKQLVNQADKMDKQMGNAEPQTTPTAVNSAQASTPAPTTSNPPQQASNSITKADYDKLPSGATYQVNGITFRKK